MNYSSEGFAKAAGAMTLARGVGVRDQSRRDAVHLLGCWVNSLVRLHLLEPQQKPEGTA